MMIFSGSSNKLLASDIAKHLQMRLSELEIFVFPDGERRIRVVDDVVDKDTVVVQPTNTPSDQNYMELFFAIDGLKRSGAKSVSVVIPYLGYERQDHVFQSGEAVSLDVIIETLGRVGAAKIILFDLHSIRIPELFKIPVLHLSALPLFAQKIKENFDLKKSVLVSPDMGGIRRIKLISEMLENIPFAVIEKNRDLKSGEVSSFKIEGSVSGKIAIIVDDMISTGKTIEAAANLLLKNGVKDIFVFATHGVFSKQAPKILQKTKIKKVFVTDTVYIPKEKYFAKLEILGISEIIAQGLKEF